MVSYILFGIRHQLASGIIIRNAQPFSDLSDLILDLSLFFVTLRQHFLHAHLILQIRVFLRIEFFRHGILPFRPFLKFLHMREICSLFLQLNLLENLLVMVLEHQLAVFGAVGAEGQRSVLLGFFLVLFQDD